LCSESLFSEWAIFLRVGVTALVVAMIEEGLRPGDQLRLSAPLEAMRGFAVDPWCQHKVTTARGECLTAVAIQRRYLELAEAHLNDSFMPPWAADVCREWRQVLDLLESGNPQAVATRLDWAIRFSVVSRFLAAEGFDWPAVQKWNRVAERPMRIPAKKAAPPPDFPELDTLCDEQEVLDDLLAELAAQARQSRAPSDGIRKFQALRSRVFELDTRFGQLGGTGLFSQIERAGVLHHHIPGVDNFDHAREFPPAVGRAALRGDCVRRLGSINSSRQGCVCDWGAIWDQAQDRFLDLSDPFGQHADWKAVSRESGAGPVPFLERHRQIMELLHRARTR